MVKQQHDDKRPFAKPRGESNGSHGASSWSENLIFWAIYNVPGLVQLVYSVQFLLHTTFQIKLQITIQTSARCRELNSFFTTSELDQKEISFTTTVQWALDHCLSQLDNDERMRQQMTKYYDAENDEWSDAVWGSGAIANCFWDLTWWHVYSFMFDVFN
jgi:hypothetical protein